MPHTRYTALLPFRLLVTHGMIRTSDDAARLPYEAYSTAESKHSGNIAAATVNFPSGPDFPIDYRLPRDKSF
ncbi:hypothetical protein ANTPLA_LOCUS6337 [Anthophora plagiata]